LSTNILENCDYVKDLISELDALVDGDQQLIAYALGVYDTIDLVSDEYNDVP